MTLIMSMTGNLRADADPDAHPSRCRTWLVLAALLLAGCPGTRLAAPPATLAAPAGSATLATAIIPAARQPHGAQTVADPYGGSPGRGSSDLNGGRSDPVPPPPQTASVPPDRMEPDTLVGLDQFQTKRLLGNPSATEDDAPARVWRYAGGGCTLRVFFFKDMISEDFRALSYDLTSSHNVPNDDQRCFAHLVAQAWDDGRD